ncbi:MAG TPA: hypothetical protein PK874_03015 [Desulfobacteraceae bacterium]|nr:hypothetical protein [Desulfobacteraceae bacterium]HPJ68684.1 hypothetical protein [Desulfobacteraceae bacterium]HPQ29005.1 hypothetical protein [Desulfobacteraceae bacterium]
MRNSVLILIVLSFFFITGQTFAADNLNDAACRIESGILRVLNGIGDTISHAAEEAGKAGLNGENQIRKILQYCNAGRPYVFDSAFIDSKGIIRFIEPEQYRQHEGADISDQDVVVNVQNTKKPCMGSLFVSVEGIKSVDIAYPVFSKESQHIGSVSMLVNQDKLIRSVAAAVEKELDVRSWAMQKDGTLLYETDSARTGLNLFTAPLYDGYPELKELGRRMMKESEGVGFYTFILHGTKEPVKKRAVWRTVRFFNNDWIISVYKKIE